MTTLADPADGRRTRLGPPATPWDPWTTPGRPCRCWDPTAAGILRAARERLGLSARRVASALDTDTHMVRRVEQGQRAPSTALAEALADALDLDPEERRVVLGAARPGVGRSRPRPAGHPR